MYQGVKITPLSKLPTTTMLVNYMNKSYLFKIQKREYCLQNVKNANKPSL